MLVLSLNTRMPSPQLLGEEKFEELDCLADTARSGKTRFPGGSWKLRNIYIGLDSPSPVIPQRRIGFNVWN
jgi:hypothetical protein